MYNVCYKSNKYSNEHQLHFLNFRTLTGRGGGDGTFDEGVLLKEVPFKAFSVFITYIMYHVQKKKEKKLK